MREITTTDDARKAIKDAGITVNNVTLDQLDMLWYRLSTALRNSGNYNGTYAMNPLTDPMYMTCKTEQWGNREAVSFNRDGFIGFAGWADSNNIKPIINAVESWLKALSGGSGA